MYVKSESISLIRTHINFDGVILCLIVTDDKKTTYTGHFSTAPGGIPLFLTDIVEHFKDSVPLSAILFLGSDLCDNDIIVANLASTEVTFTQVSTKSSIIATACTVH